MSMQPHTMGCMSDSFIRIENAAHTGAFGHNLLPRPTQAQCIAGNYKVGRASLHGLDIAIEQPRGSYRTGIDAKTGKRWVNRMPAHYGYISGTKGNDGDAVDCFIGFYPQAETVFVINQNAGSRFDEHKVMLGFPDEESARQTYLNSYERGWGGLASIVATTIPQLKQWLRHGDLSRPLYAEELAFEGLETMHRIQWSNDALPRSSTLEHLLYEVRRADAGHGLLMDAVTAQDITEDADSVLTYDAMVSPYANLEHKMQTLLNIMERTGSTVKPTAVQVTAPFRQRGVANVAAIFELSDGQTVSIFFHNPDTTPAKMASTDEVISWKWLLNKKDITIVVAPERGADLNVREVARRIMRLAEKNSPAFQRHNAKRAERMKNLQSLKDEINTLESELATAQRELEVAKMVAEDNLHAASIAPIVQAPPLQVQVGEVQLLIPDGRENVVKTAKGTKIKTGFKVVEAEQLIVSHDENGKPNPDFPQELQPRDRARDTSQIWVQKTARSLDPDSLGRTQRADSGAPIIGSDGVVESGNGRTMAIKEAYRLGMAEEYRAWLEQEAGYFGVNDEAIKRMTQPVLVRIRTSSVDRASFAVEANQDDKLAMTATEKARSDALRLTDDVIAKMTDDGELLSAANRNFIGAFLQSLGDAEAAQYVTSSGQPTASLVARVQAAIFAKAYNDDRLLELTADSAKPEIANIIAALNVAAPAFIRAQTADRQGAEDAAAQLTDSIEVSLNTQAVDAIIGATEMLKRSKESGMNIEEFVRHGDMFGEIDPAAAAMALFISKNNRSAKRMGTAFRAMAEFVRSENLQRQNTNLFGDESSALSFTDIVAAANRQLEKEFGEGMFAIEQVGLFSPSVAPDSSQLVPATPITDPQNQKSTDRALFQSVIDGSVVTEDGEGILSPQVAQLLEPAYYRNQDDAELLALFERAVDAYQNAMLAATANLS